MENQVQVHNKQQMDRAYAMLYELLHEALTRDDVSQVVVRIPKNGVKFGKPKGSIERE